MSVDELSNKEKFKEFEKINKKVVQNFIASRGKTNKVGKQEILHYNKKAVGRVYYLEPSGYVVATLNKNEVPIKAYAFSGSFDNLPEDYKDFLTERLYEYDGITEEAEKTQIIETDNKKVWEYLENYTKDSPKPTIESSVIDMNENTERPPELPFKRSFTQNHESSTKFLLNTKWYQTSPFNLRTEKLDGIRTLTGCIPTAWAQIMKFHEWPVKPRGITDRYYWYNGGKYIGEKNFNNVAPYNWQNMPEYGNLEVARLMADIGYAVNSQWGFTETSSDSVDDKLDNIEKFFGYSENMTVLTYYYFTSDTSYDFFADAIKRNINRLRPLYFEYRAYSSGSVVNHATVIDGYYNTTYNNKSVLAIHINFGNLGSGDFYIVTKDYTINYIPSIKNDGSEALSFSKISIVDGIKPCTNFENDCYINFAFDNSGKKGLELKNGWNLVSLIGNNDDINYRDFTNADTISTSTPVWKFDNGSWITNPTDIKPKDVLWIKHLGTKEYVFPGSQTSDVVLNATDIDNAPSGNWLLGTGGEIPLSLLTSHGVTNCQIYDPEATPTPSWVTCPGTIPAGSGIAIQKQ